MRVGAGVVVGEWAEKSSMQPFEYLNRARLLTAAYDKGHNLRAREVLKKGIELFPRFARFYAWLSYTYVLEYRRFDTSDPSCLVAAEELVGKALQLDRDDYYVNWSQAIGCCTIHPIGTRGISAGR
jgi:hypothetical protein